jgi:hypothetical protein
MFVWRRLLRGAGFISAVAVLTVIAVAAGTVSADVNPLVLNTLVQWFSSLGGSSWKKSDRWLQGDPCVNRWYGIGCDSTNSVILSMSLGSNGLNGTLPDVAFVGLSGLKRLVLSSNRIQGELPLDMDVPSLTYLDLSMNMLEGSVPSTLGQAGALQFLYLQGNLLEGPFPSALLQLNLLGLKLAQNRFSGTLPANLASALSRVIVLDLSSNDFTGCLPSFDAMLTLTTLNISKNRLSCSLPSFPGSLQSLDASGNDFKCPIPPGQLFQNVQCTYCDPGYGLEGSSCVICAAGQFSTGLTSCQECVSGYYAANRGQSECIKCPAGTFSSYAGSSQCTNSMVVAILVLSSLLFLLTIAVLTAVFATPTRRPKRKYEHQEDDLSTKFM